ncbi:hypothetical protein HMPREF0484_3763 [Klebsiella pneumoniae subsp. rhinoscleromatis ATCC 13884]|uniref:hypothetical protein n=1 Tax=Klebsiella pneumoniae TaxID=573 RepID=UPI0001B75BAA|nr:hypothetical protein [Klebsiella pneumoniae]EEW40135.1 hypothetical protein HMPREF0484_3763 [Klebsiella pneumoniae subsp. rhinoscleromatis ATCC 13884]STV73924.1 Uncharacterised protein [Klebsiella pneumoniae subsp. rhinoscleromatis]
MHKLICTSATGVAADYFVVDETYTADEKWRITTSNSDESLALWTVENYRIYSIAGDSESAVIATFTEE